MVCSEALCRAYSPYAFYRLNLGLRPRLVYAGPSALNDELYSDAKFALAAVRLDGKDESLCGCNTPFAIGE
jgi:hypothetical protein